MYIIIEIAEKNLGKGGDPLLQHIILNIKQKYLYQYTMDYKHETSLLKKCFVV